MRTLLRYCWIILRVVIGGLVWMGFLYNVATGRYNLPPVAPTILLVNGIFEMLGSGIALFLANWCLLSALYPQKQSWDWRIAALTVVIGTAISQMLKAHP